MLRVSFFILLLTLGSTAAADLIDEIHDSKGGLNGRLPGPGLNLQQIQTAFDDARPTDNVRVFQIGKMEAPRLRLREFMETLIVLPEGEKISAYTIGDSTNFTFVALDGDSANIGRVRAEYPGADTNLSLIGSSGRIYPFYLRADSVESEHMPMFVVYVEDQERKSPRSGTAVYVAKEPKGSSSAESKQPTKPVSKKPDKEGEYLRSLPDVDVTAVNCSYETSGGSWFRRNARWFGRSVSRDLSPIRICDDGQWTYFRFSKDSTLDGVEQLPVVYVVVDGYDTPVNSRVEGGVIIAETTAKNWTLRAGDKHLCVRRK